MPSFGIRRGGKGKKEASTTHVYYLLAVMVFAVAMALYFDTGVSQYNTWDIFDYVFSSHIISVYGMRAGLKYLMALGGPVWDAFFANEYILLWIPSLFYNLLGVNVLSVSLYGILCLVGVVAALFWIGRTIYSPRAGILSALAFACIPAVVLEVGSAGDGLAVAFFSSVTVLAALEADRRGKNYLYAIPGILAAIGAMAGSVEVFIAMVFLLLLMTYRTVRRHGKARRAAARGLGMLVIGAAAGALLIFLAGLVLVGNYYAFFGAGGSYTPINTYFVQRIPPLSGVIEGIFPTYYGYSYSLSWVWPYAAFDPAQATKILWPYGIAETGSPYIRNVIGFFGYLMVACAAYLAYRRRWEMLLPLAWLVVVLGYLSFGISGGLHNFIGLDPRLFIAAMPPLALVIGVGIDCVIADASLRIRVSKLPLRVVLYACIAVALLLILSTTVYLVEFYNQTYAAQLYPWVQAGRFVAGLPRNTTVYIVSIVLNASYPAAVAQGNNTVAREIEAINVDNMEAVGFYSGYGYNFNYSYLYSNCSAIKTGSYLLVFNDTGTFIPWAGGMNSAGLSCNDLTRVNMLRQPVPQAPRGQPQYVTSVPEVYIKSAGHT